MARRRSGVILNMTPPVFTNLVFGRENRNLSNPSSLSKPTERLGWNAPGGCQPALERGPARRSSHTERPSLARRVKSLGNTARRGPLTASHRPRAEPQSEGLRPPSDTGQALFRTPHFPNPPVGRGFGAGLFPFRSALLRECTFSSCGCGFSHGCFKRGFRFQVSEPSATRPQWHAPSDTPPASQSRKYCFFLPWFWKLILYSWQFF